MHDEPTENQPGIFFTQGEIPKFNFKDYLLGWLDTDNRDSVTGVELAERMGIRTPTSADYRRIAGFMEEFGWSSKRVAAGTLYLRPRDRSLPDAGTSKEEVMGVLNGLLEQAQEGHLHAIIGLYRTHDGKVHPFWPGTNDVFSGAATPAELWEMVGRLDLLKAEILNRHLRQGRD